MRSMSFTSKVISICAILLAASTVVNANVVTYNGIFTPSTLGNSLSTNLTQFNSSWGTLTGVQIGLSIDVNPYAMVGNFTMAPLTFTTNDSIIYGYNSTDIWTISHSSDSWLLTAPTVSTGTIMGANQSISPFSVLTLTSSNSANVSFAGSALSANLSQYVGSGTLSFGTSGAGQVLINDGALYGGGGGNLIGTATVTYTYNIPEPATMGLLALGSLALIQRKK